MPDETTLAANPTPKAGDLEHSQPSKKSGAFQHHSVYCPTCSTELNGHRCKLICGRCGYYLSCSDFY